MITTKSAIRFVVCLHAVALLALPKTSFGLTSFRPEDLTGMILLALFCVLAAAGSLWIPDRNLATLVLLYATYLGLALVVHDWFRGYIQASVFLAKEASYLVFGYLVWRAYGSDPEAFLAVLTVAAVPNLLYGFYQLATQPAGIYGVSPFGHEDSPASSGLIYLTYTIVMFLACLAGRQVWLHAGLLFLSMTLLVTSGSKVAVVGALAFYGWYLVQWVLRKRSVNSLASLGFFGIAAVAGISLAVSAASLGYSWRGLGRYRGLLVPWQVMVERGIWWKFKWIDDPLSIIVGAGYSPGRLVPGEPYRYGMAMDNQVLYYLVTGGVFALILYVILMTMLYKILTPRLPNGRVLRALVLAYVFMGLGSESLQLSVSGNLFWMVTGLCLTTWSVRGRPQ